MYIDNIINADETALTIRFFLKIRWKNVQYQNLKNNSKLSKEKLSLLLSCNKRRKKLTLHNDKFANTRCFKNFMVDAYEN